LVHAVCSALLVMVTEHNTDSAVATGVALGTAAMPANEAAQAVGVSGAWQLMVAVVTAALEPPQVPETKVDAVPCVESWTDAVKP
jgi:hypothetical protein